MEYTINIIPPTYHLVKHIFQNSQNKCMKKLLVLCNGNKEKTWQAENRGEALFAFYHILMLKSGFAYFFFSVLGLWWAF